MCRILYAFFFLFFFSTSAFSFWPKEVYEHADQFPMQLQGQFATTLTGTCMEPKGHYRRMNGHVEKIAIKNSLLKGKKMNIRLASVYKRDQIIDKNAPFVFFIPGAFNNLDDNQGRHLMDLFLEKGYNVVTTPNPWGTDFIKLGVKSPIGSFVYEGEVLYETFLNTFKKLKRDGYNVPSIRLVGVSYGSFLSAMISAFNVKDNYPLPLKDTTILSPPFHLGETISRLDHYVNESRPYINDNLVKSLYRLVSFCRNVDYRDYEKFSENKAMSLVIGAGFHRDLIASTILYDRLNNIDKIPGRFWRTLSKKHLKWRKNLTFKQYFNTYAKDARAQMMSRKGDINYWLDLAREGGYDDFRILTTDNDFLNEPISAFSPIEKTITLQSGGHYGYRGLSWYRQLIDLSF